MAPLVAMATLPVSDKLSPNATIGIAPAPAGVMKMTTLMPRLMPVPRIE
jgi:hypothetical protein